MPDEREQVEVRGALFAVGRLRVGPFLGRASRRGAWSPVLLTELNAQPAILAFQGGVLANAFVLDLTSEGVTAVYAVRNPDKLKRLQASEGIAPHALQHRQGHFRGYPGFVPRQTFGHGYASRLPIRST